MSGYQFLDELVKEYLVFRGFVTTLKWFDSDLKYEKEKGFRVDRVLESINQSVSTHDLNSLLEIWKHFETTLFSKLDPNKASSVKKLESSVLKLYLVYCIQNKQTEKIREFFEKLTPELQPLSEWKDWFALPYLKDPHDNPLFSIYFSRHWQDTLMISLHNFFILCFQSMPPPRLADYLKTAARIKMLKDEQMRLKLKLAQAGYDEDLNLSSGNIKYFEAPPSQEIMDDFFLIAQEAGKTDTQVKSIKSFLKTITGNRSTKSPSSQPAVSRVKPTNLSVSKTPLKRISPASVKPSNLSSTSTTSNTSLEKQEVKEDQVDQLSQDQDDLSEKSEKDFESNLLMTPATPGSQYLLLGQEEYNEHRSTVCALQVSPSGLVATADVSGVVKVWSTGASMHPSTISTFISASPVSCLVWLDDRKLIYGTHMGQVRLCDVEDKCLVMETSCNKLTGQPISALASRPSGSSFFVCSADKALIINSKNFSVEIELVDPALTGVSAAHFNHNGALLIFATNKGKVGIMDLNRNEILATWSGHQKGVIGLELSLDETSVWSLGREGTLLQSSLLRPGDKVWSGDVSTKDGFTGDFALSPDGEHVLYGSDEGAVIYRIGEQDGEMIRVLGIRGVTPITSVHWSTGSCGTILAAGMDGSLKISTLLQQ